MAELHGLDRAKTISCLRVLFHHCKQAGTIFRDPARRIRPGTAPHSIILPLTPTEIRQAVEAATPHPRSRLVLALAGVHAARSGAICNLRLDDADLGNRRLTIASHTRPLDELTYQAITGWLHYRRSRWPRSVNPHLIISQITATKTTPVSRAWNNQTLRGLTATLERLRVDRQLDEALTRGPDPLHLTAVFGIAETTAIRYTEAAHQILQTPDRNGTSPHEG